MQQAPAEPLLQPGDGLGDCRLGEPEFTGGASKGARFGDAGEYGPGFEVRKIHRCSETMSFERFYL